MLAGLLCMLDETGLRSRSHGLPRAVLEAQADRLGVPVVFRSATWERYTDAFVEAVAELRASGIEHGVFGDIDLDGHRDWVQGVCARAGVGAHLPLWRDDRRPLVEEGLTRGIRSQIVVVNTALLPGAFLGRTLDAPTLDEVVAAGADACGENGEYHTVVTRAPGFSRDLGLRVAREVALGDYVAQVVALAQEGGGALTC